MWQSNTFSVPFVLLIACTTSIQALSPIWLLSLSFSTWSRQSYSFFPFNSTLLSKFQSIVCYWIHVYKSNVKQNTEEKAVTIILLTFCHFIDQFMMQKIDPFQTDMSWDRKKCLTMLLMGNQFTMQHFYETYIGNEKEMGENHLKTDQNGKLLKNIHSRMRIMSI